MSIFNATDKIVLTFVYAAITIIGTCGNVVVLMSLCLRSKARRVQGNIFIISLAFADFFSCTLCGPYYIRSLHVSDFFQSRLAQSWICVAILVVAYLLSIESIFSLTLLSLDRYCAVRFPFWYQKRVTRKICVTGTLVSWGCSFVLVFPPAVMPGWISYENEPGSPCGFQWTKASGVYIGFGVICSFVIPAIIVSITNIFVFKTAREQNLKIETTIKLNFESSEAVSEIKHSPKILNNKAGIRNIARSTNQRANCFMSSCHLLKDSSALFQARSHDNNERVRSISAKMKSKSSIHLESKSLLKTSIKSGPSVNKKYLFAPEGKPTRHLSLENLNESKLDCKDNYNSKIQILDFLQPLHQFSSSENNLLELKDNNSRLETLNREREREKRLNRTLSKIKRRSSAKTEMKLALATVSISLLFFLSWFPFLATRVLKSLGMVQVSSKVINYSSVFALMSSAWNPYVVLLTRREILAGFKDLFKSLKKQKWKKK